MPFRAVTNGVNRLADRSKLPEFSERMIRFMEKEKRVLVFDFGASGGQAFLAGMEGDAFRIDEIHRFPNDPVEENGALRWNVPKLFAELKEGLAKARDEGGFVSVAVDTWGVDFGLLDKAGRLMENPVHYRDGRTHGMIAKSSAYITEERFYEITGIQTMEINTAFQLLSLTGSGILERADRFLMMPDLFNYFLTGVKNTEYTIATTTQLLNSESRSWSREVCECLGIPIRLFTGIEYPGKKVGTISEKIQEKLGLSAVPVFSAASHDTASAVAAVPASGEDFIFISCGTWSLLGTELKEPVISGSSRRYGLTNEGGFGGTTTFLKNIVGLWLIQECRREWRREGKEYAFSELEASARKERPFACLIDPNAPDFIAPGDLPARVRAFCEKTGQYVPQSDGEIIRCIYDSLALEYRRGVRQVGECTGRSYSAVHIVGGGAKDALLCSLTASVCGLPVLAGPAEATAFGNAAVQMISLGILPNIGAARRCIANSQKITHYSPEKAGEWDTAFSRYEKILRTYPKMKG